MSAGYIYIFTNSSLKKGIMVGYTEDWKEKLKNVNESSILADDYRPYLIYKTDEAFSGTSMPSNIFDTLFRGLKLFDNIYDVKRKKVRKLIFSIARIYENVENISYQEENEAELAEENKTIIEETSCPEDEIDDIEEDIQKIDGHDDAEVDELYKNKSYDGEFIGLDEFCNKVNIESPNGFEARECHFLNQISVVSSMKEIVEFVLQTLYDESPDKFKEACSKPALENYIRLSNPNLNNFTKVSSSSFYYKSNMLKREMYFLFDNLTNFTGCEIIKGGLMFGQNPTEEKPKIDTGNDEYFQQDEDEVEYEIDDDEYDSEIYNYQRNHININENINFEGTIAYGLVYQGREYKTTDGLYSQLIDWVIDLFPKVSNGTIDYYVSSEHRMFRDSNYISNNSSDLANPHKLGDYDFFIEEDITPSQAIRFIRYYISQARVNPSSFEIIIGW